ncbi:substrate-binding periplasmic protein [Desulfovibrio inopinatus]|uniref:substrate-binding periplasmic protein n=1 Tax=Desulfovibrio inopinatus TaxID=102109 RepID=UPI0004204E04|nr:ABC transporter substrate-binding protein [Desulfovibrio inopinatus]
MVLRIVISVVLSVFCIFSEKGNAETIALTSLDWPPYSSAHLVGHGATVEIVRQAFNAVGLDVEVHFFPWKRAISTAQHDAHFVGYFPEYYAAHLSSCLFSASIGESPLGFAERIDHPVSWKSLEGLKPYSIGVVKGYVNTAAFDSLVMNEQLQVDLAGNDEINIAKLAAGRIDLAVIDKNVFQYLMATSPKLAEYRGRLRFNNTLLENKHLYICFRPGKSSQRLVDKFNTGLATVNVHEVQNSYVEKALGKE